MREERARRAEIDTKQFARKVTVTFDHYGAMGDPGQKRMMESSTVGPWLMVKRQIGLRVSGFGLRTSGYSVRLRPVAAA